jgi:surface protein
MGTSPRLTYNPGSASSSQSTMVNSSGHLVWAPHNLAKYSEQFDNWGVSRTTISADATPAPNGPLVTADKLVETDETGVHITGYSGTISVVSGKTYIFSVYAKAAERTYIGLFEGVTAKGKFFDLTAGEKGGNLNSAPLDASIIDVGNNWYRCEIAVSAGAIFVPSIYISTDGSTISYQGDITKGLYIWGAHVYRSDLGGMAPVPGAATGFETYVPTNGNAEYLPRVGHHVYNGSTWVNEGLLIESEVRTNLELNSNSGNPNSYGQAGLDYTGQTLRTTGPDGVADSMLKLQEDTSTNAHRFATARSVSVGTNTFSCIVKDAGDGRYVYWRTNNDGTNQWINFNPATGEVTEVGTAVNDYGVIDLGGGFYRIWFSCDSADGSSGWILASSNSATPGNTIPSFAGTLEAGFYFGFIQVEAGSTPSSYIPTSGSTVTRGGQSLTVPPAQFGWPEPEYIGPELVTDFSTYADQAAFDVDWTRGTGWTFSGGVASSDGTQVSRSSLYAFPLTVGKVYEFSMEVSSVTAGNVRLRNGIGGSEVYIADQSSAGTYTGIATVVGGVTLVVDADADFVGSIDNISVREINPLSVSIQMDGRMTYADNDVGASATFVTAGSFVTGTTYVIETVGTTNFTAIGAEANTVGTVFTATGAGSGDGTALPMTAQLAKWGGVGMALDTHDTATGGFVFTTDDGNTEYVETSDTALTPGVLVPFNISSRHGSTFVNGAVDGVALTADTTPTALPDLSNTDLEIAKDFMGTIGTFRQFAGDIGDTGLEEASLTPYGTDFVMTITTTSADETFTIPCQNFGTFDASIDWGDGSFSGITAYDDAGLAHTFASAGDHTIRISGSFPNIYFNNGGDRLKVTRVDNLGNVGWATFERAFFGCSNMTSFAGGNTDTSAVTSMDVMFYNCSSLTSLDLSNFDTSAVTNMSEMFYNCSSLTSLDVSSFDTSVVTSMAVMFRYCSSLTSLDVSGFNTSAVTGMARMFADCSSLTDVIGVENFDIEGLDNTNDLKEFMFGVTLPTARYDALLVNWDAQEPFDGMSPNFGNSKYTANSAAAAARANLISNDGWTITDGGTA